MTSTFFYIAARKISTSSRLLGKRNFRKFIIPKRGTNIFKETQHPDLPLFNYGVREVGFWDEGEFITIPEKIPEIVVPDLTSFQLKPYVSYRVPDVVQSEFTEKDLFEAIYAKKIVDDFKSGKLDESGNPLEPSEEESLTPDQAWIKARQTGSDIFTERSKREEEEKYFFK